MKQDQRGRAILEKGAQKMSDCRYCESILRKLLFSCLLFIMVNRFGQPVEKYDGLYLKDHAPQWIAEKPEIWEEPAFCEYGKRAVWYSGLNGKRNFAWIGLPEGASSERKVPGIVLIHGGGGTAFASWVDFWTKRGYAAIAMDTCGAFPDTRKIYGNWPRHSYSGPAGWGAFAQAALPPEHQWFPHAVASVIKATTILADLPEVDSSRLGLTGISWGGRIGDHCCRIGSAPESGFRGLQLWLPV